MSSKIYDPETGEAFELRTREEAGLAPPRWINPLADFDLIVRHHTVTAGTNPAGELRAVQSFHFSKGWADIAYQYGWDDNGTLWKLRGHERVGGATEGQNYHSVSIVYIGNAETKKPTAKGFRALLALEAMLREVSPGAEVVSVHQDWASTQCAGKFINEWTRAGSPRVGTPEVPSVPKPPPAHGCRWRHQGADPRDLFCQWPNNPRTWLRGNDVAEIQFLLNALNAGDARHIIEVDGVYGPGTVAAVRRFQAIWRSLRPGGPSVSGRVGPRTRAAICEALRIKGIW